ncbi:hypothetical protein HPB50_015828 [Hyalomma asiaticum]|uniref:Uncharacterized protein n=1 Tax=Hyalomma asiaticum TaxID=266040 RepID=A0ACB7SNW2_HYAAI|nr:hypothetical protein HPB50_015828 [Hyalomma asiaticum]
MASFRQVNERHVSAEVELMLWSPRLDLIALALKQGDVALHRLSWKRVWLRSPPGGKEHDVSVLSLAWRPDGKILAIGYSTAYLPRLPNLNKSYGCTSSAKSVEENVDDSKMLKEQEDFNILVVGLANGSVSLYAYDHFSRLTVVIESERDGTGKCMYLHVYNMPQLREKQGELRILALKYGQVASLAGYLASTMSSIKEAWEDILLEVDSKLANYAQEKRRTSSGTVSDDFLELLMFGTPSDALEKFLKYVLKQLQGVTQAIYFHLADLQGMALWEDKFGSLGLSSTAVANALGCTGSYLLKLAELLQVIEVSIRNFKAFFRWLYMVILRLSDDTVPLEVTRISQQEIVFVAEFLKENFAVEWSEEDRLSFSLERVGQYLKDEPLVFPLPAHLNAWLKFLEQNPAVLNLAIPHHSKSSLVQEHKQLESAAEGAFVGLTDALRPCVLKAAQVALATIVQPDRLYVLSHVTSGKDDCIYSSFVPCRSTGQDLYLVKRVRTFEMDVEEEDDETGDEDEEDKDAKFTAEKDITDFQDDDKENSF